MSISRGRLAIAIAALVLLSAIGTGVAQASSASPGSSPAPAPAASTTAAGPAGSAPAIDRLRVLRDRYSAHPGRHGRHLVHSTVTVVGRDGKLITFQFDHGTIAAIGDHSISIAETGGATISVATTDATRVRKDRAPADLADLAIGDEVFVASRVDAGTATARGIVVPPARPGPAATPSAVAS